jgi:hypothetical protein
MGGSKWRSQIDAIHRHLPRSAGREIEGILMRIIDPAAPGMIAGLAYECCAGYSHPLDGQSIDFDPPIGREEVPAPWLTLWLEGAMPDSSATA